MKKSFKIIVASLSLLAGASVATPISPIFKAKSVLADTQSEVKTIGMKILKTGTTTPSIATNFLGNKAQVTIANGKITQVTISCPRKIQFMGTYDVTQIMKKVVLNGYTATTSTSSDGNTVNFVFPGAAYSADKGVISFGLQVFGNSVMNESADIYFDKVDLTNSTSSSSATTTTSSTDTSSSSTASSSTSATTNTANTNVQTVISTDTTSANSNNTTNTTNNTNNTTKKVTSKSLDLTKAKTISLKLTKTGTSKASEAAMYLGKTAKVIMKNGKVSQVVLHVNGNLSQTKGQDMTKILQNVTLNGVKATIANAKSDGSSFDLVFPAKAYKTTKGKMNFTLNVMGKQLNVSADATLGKVATKKTTKRTRKVTKKVRRTRKTAKKRVVRKHTRKIAATKRTLKHNAYIYLRNGKRANKKVLKKGQKVTTYGRIIKLHGKYFYRISRNTYVKKANF